MHYGLSIGIIRGSQSLVITVKIIVSLAISKMIILFHFSPSMVTGVFALARHTGRSGRVNRHLPPVPEVLPQLDARERRHDDNPDPR